MIVSVHLHIDKASFLKIGGNIGWSCRHLNIVAQNAGFCFWLAGRHECMFSASTWKLKQSQIDCWNLKWLLGEAQENTVCSSAGPVAQWITRLTTDQKIPGSNPGRFDSFGGKYNLGVGYIGRTLSWFRANRWEKLLMHQSWETACLLIDICIVCLSSIHLMWRVLGSNPTCASCF